MSQTKTIDHLGQITALTSLGSQVAFVTEHEERRPTSLVVLDLEKSTTAKTELECYGTALLLANDSLWIAGSDNQVYTLPADGKGKPKSVSTLPVPGTCLVALSENRIGVAVESQVLILNDKGKTQQTIECDQEVVTSLASNPDGQWLAVGFRSGKVAVYTCESSPDETVKKKSTAYRHSATSPLHKNAVNSLLFEDEELRFFSAAADGTLLLTHARGELEAEDRGRSANHADSINQLIWANEDRFISCSADKTCKSWARVGSARPATFDKWKRNVVALAVVSVHQRPALVLAAGSELAVVKLDVNGRFLDVTIVYQDGYAAAQQSLDSGNLKQVGEALNQLADFDDRRAIEMLSQVAAGYSDHEIRFRAAELIVKATHPTAKSALENLLKHEDGPVRVKAFGGLLQRCETGDLEPVRMAIRLGKEDLGKLCVQLLEKQAAKDELARNELLYAFELDPRGVRQAALLALEKVYPKDSPLPDIQGTLAKSPDLRKLALMRFLHRNMLDLDQVQAVIRRCLEDSDADVRYTAFQVLVASSKKLSATLRADDPQYHQQMFELESWVPETSENKSKKTKAASAEKAAKKPAGKLSDEDLAPLLTSMACIATDTCLAGATHLAKLGDARALGMLLQLSREPEKNARVEVCVALEKLAEPRSLQRLVAMLDDEEVSVRDAAFSAVDKLGVDDPLFVADAGMKSAFDNVRQRALKTLLKYARKSRKQASEEPVVELLLRALNDPKSSVAKEAFKGITNSKLYGNEASSLRFCLQSVSTDIRGAVLDDAIGMEKETWAQELILDLMDDPDTALSQRSFDYASQKKKHRDLPVLERALASRHADVQMSAIGRLKTWGTTACQAAIGTALADKNRQVRAAAINALTQSTGDQVAADLEAAIQSEFDDVRGAAARHFAQLGDRRAYEPLVKMASQDEPKNSEEKAEWLDQSGKALVLLGELGDPRATEVLFPFLEHEEIDLRRCAAEGLISVSSEADVPRLTPWLRDSDPLVSCFVGMALARLQQRVAMPVIFGEETVLPPVSRIEAALCYEAAGENQFAAMGLDHHELWVRNATLMTLLMRDWLNHNGTPDRILTCLSAQSPRVRLLAADAILAFGNPKELKDLMNAIVNQRGDLKPWEIPAAEIEDVASLLVFGSSFIKTHVFKLLGTLVEPKQHGWNRESKRLLSRFAEPLAEIKATRKKNKLPKLDAKSNTFHELAFGVHVGLVREQNTDRSQAILDPLGSSVLAVRLSALRKLVQLAVQDEKTQTAVLPVLVQALRDVGKPIRDLAFESLKTLKMDDTQRATVAIESGVDDLAVMGMNLLIESGSSAAAKKTLTAVVTQRDNRLAHDAAKLLLEKYGVVEAATAALESPRRNLRTTAVAWLANAYEDDPKAKKMLQAAVDSRYENVRKAAPLKLADKQDPQAFDTLLNLLKQKDNAREFGQQATALVALAERNGSQGKTAQVLLDLIDDGDLATNQPFIQPVYYGVGVLREQTVLDRVLDAFDRPERFGDAFSTALKISGYDQRIEDPDDEKPDREWMKTQHPRHASVLAQLVQRCMDLGRYAEISSRLMPGMRWCLTSENNELLSKLAFGPDEALRHQCLSAIAWRLEKRPDACAGLEQVLDEALTEKDVTASFLAAEGLAKIGRDTGLAVLMSTCELHERLDYRQRAVVALGEVASPVALDLLLRYASQADHALQASAAEAIGHYNDSEHQEQIIQMLLQYSRSTDFQLLQNAIVGLRHFDSPKAWDRVREICQDANLQWLHTKALEQLEFNDTPATRDLLLKYFETYRDDQAYAVARKVFGADSLEPDIALAIYGSEWIDLGEAIERLQKNATADQLFDVINRFESEYWHPECEFGAPRIDKIAQALLAMDPIPAKVATANMASECQAPVRVAARLLGTTADASHSKSIEKSLERWWDHWRVAKDSFDLDSQNDSLQVLLELVNAAAACGAKSTLMNVLESGREQAELAPLRLAAVKAIAKVKLAKADVAKLKKLVADPGIEFQRELLKRIATQDAKTANSVLESSLLERRTFHELSQMKGVDASGLLPTAVRDKNNQSVVLPLLIKEKNTKLLGEVAAESKLADSLRLGAIEGLACIEAADSEKQLVAIGKDKKMDDEIRKAAWRGLRRWKRMTGHAKP